MECKAGDSKKLLKVFDCSKRKMSKNKKDKADDTISALTDDSSSLNQVADLSLLAAGKASLPDVAISQGDRPTGSPKRISSRSVSPSPDGRDPERPSSRRYRRPHRNGVSLALKSGVISTPRSTSPQQEGDCIPDAQVHDSFIYTVLEDEIKKDKRKQRHARRHEEQRERTRERVPAHEYERERERDRPPGREYSRERDYSPADRDHTPTNRDHRHRHRHRDSTRDRLKAKEKSLHQAMDQALLIETFAKLCSTITEQKRVPPPTSPITNNEAVGRTQSHKSLQCEVVIPQQPYEMDPSSVRLQKRSECVLSPRHARSYENVHDYHAAIRSPTRILDNRKDKYCPLYDKGIPKYASKLDMVCSKRNLEMDRRNEYPAFATKSYMDHSYKWEADRRDCRDYDEYREIPRGRRSYEDEKRRFCEQKTSRSFEVPREAYADDERYRQTARSDSFRKRNEDLKYFQDRHCDEREKAYGRRREKYYDAKQRDNRDRHCSNLSSKDRRSRRNIDRLERMSVASRDDDKERDRYSERERDSGLSIADGDTSTISCRSNYLKVVKQEIVEQREAMDKMMKLWKELMRCFKGMSQNQAQDKTVHENAATVQESAAAQLRLWRECMRRYETVARDVGDTDARLMEEISKQRSEMAEMAGMWQECLQRYRDISSDFNSLKKQLASESPTRAAPPLVCAEGEGLGGPAPPYRLPPNYPPPPMGGMASYPGGSPLRSRASAPPPAWWWVNEQPPPARRRSSPDSRGSRDRRHRHKPRDNSRSKEKSSSKQSAARSEHRHRKR